jgi:hypothetical protein
LPRINRKPRALWRCQPEGNGCIERFFRTLKEQPLWVLRFQDVEELQAAVPNSATDTTANGPSKSCIFRPHGRLVSASLRSSRLLDYGEFTVQSIAGATADL